MSDTPSQPATSDLCKCGHTFAFHKKWRELKNRKCDNFEPAVVAPDATADEKHLHDAESGYCRECVEFGRLDERINIARDEYRESKSGKAEKPLPDYAALIARGCEFLAKIDFLYEPGDNRKSWSDYRIIDDLTRALEAVSAKPSQAEARLASLRQRATDLANDLEAAGYHGFAFGAQKIANIAARGSNEAAPSNTLRERIEALKADPASDLSWDATTTMGEKCAWNAALDAVLSALGEKT